jgi:hypothetical protein
MWIPLFLLRMWLCLRYRNELVLCRKSMKCSPPPSLHTHSFGLIICRFSNSFRKCLSDHNFTLFYNKKYKILCTGLLIFHTHITNQPNLYKRSSTIRNPATTASIPFYKIIQANYTNSRKVCEFYLLHSVYACSQGTPLAWTKSTVGPTIFSLHSYHSLVHHHLESVLLIPYCY